ncbi:MAG: NAD(P)/FAD-dependent oxidoreductase [Actinomycetota bacterium]|nr:NAD(P)/FAD-dependent oxidoreductase [Actinomycetota bacterium]
METHATDVIDAAESSHQGGVEHHEVIVIGAGVCGIYALHRLREIGVDVKVLEAGGDVGGTWYWNRYPGCRFDSESYSYGYAFSTELLADWHWTERFSPQPETLRYLEHVVDRFDLRRDMRFDSRVESAHWDDVAGLWRLHLVDGADMTCELLLPAIGLLSAPTLPRYEGLDDFNGLSFHTYQWPHEPVDLSDKRVAVVGTGATGVQIIGAIAAHVGSLHVFQRRPNWCAPLHNGPISDAEMDDIRSRYDEILERCAETPGGFIHGPDSRSYHDVAPGDRYAFWEELYTQPGFGIWLANFREVLMEEEANAEFSAFVADKIRQRVNDPTIAEKLIPTDHGFGVQRVPLETNYYEAYNHEHVHLVDISEAPIERIVPEGIRTSDATYEFDVIIYATGFDAITGAFDRMDIRGRDGVALRDVWDTGPRTYLGVQVVGFPNLIMLAGPQGASVSTNFPRAIETSVEWASDLISHMRSNGYHRIECTDESQDAWVREVEDLYGMVLLRNARSWFTGYNSNVDGHDIKRHMIYNGGAPRYRKRVATVAANGYDGFVLS